MLDYYFTFRSVTFAQRAQQELAKMRIPASLLRAPISMSAKGCGYALRLRAKDVARAAEIFRSHGVPFSALYRVAPDGRAEAVKS